MSAADEAISTQDLIARRSRLLGPAYRLFYDQPVQFVRGEGVWLYDAAGHRYLDAYNNVASVGHCHPQVVQAIARQAAVLNTHTRYLHETVLDFAEKLLATFPPEIGHVMFTCTGSEANDLALRVARTCTGGTGFIVTANAYHGVTSALTELSPSLGLPLPEGSHVRLVPAPGSAARRRRSLCRVTSAMRLADMKKSGIRPAALLVDTIFSSDGVFADPTRLFAPGGRSRPGGRRAVHRRRGATRLRPLRRADVGLCPPRPRPRSRHHGQADGQRPSRRRDGGAPGTAGGVWPAVALLQHLWRQPGFRRRRHCGARRDRIRRVDAERATHRWLSGQIARAATGATSIDRGNPRCRACSSASSCGTADKRERLPQRRPRVS